MYNYPYIFQYKMNGGGVQQVFVTHGMKCQCPAITSDHMLDILWHWRVDKMTGREETQSMKTEAALMAIKQKKNIMSNRGSVNVLSLYVCLLLVKYNHYLCYVCVMCSLWISRCVWFRVSHLKLLGLVVLQSLYDRREPLFVISLSSNCHCS